MKMIMLVLLIFASAISTARAASATKAEDYTTICVATDDTAWCEASREQFLAEVPRALSGDHLSQSNVAYCFNTGCDGAVTKNPMLGCAWRVVILVSGSPLVDDIDDRNFETFCADKLGQRQISASMEQARQLFRLIYRRTMPDFPW
jgi:hypothetical protein